MKVLYFWDENMVYDHSVVYKNDSDVPNPLPANATTVAPKNGSFQPIKWNGVDDWKGSTREEYLASLPKPEPVTPTAEQQMIMQQSTDITQLKQLVMTQAGQIATLSKGSAE